VTGKKLVVLVLLLGLFGSAGAAADFVVDGLEEEGINRTFTADGMRFTTDYMNQTLPFKNATYPDDLHDDLTKWSYSTTIKENSSQLDFQSEWNSSVTGVLGSVIDALAGRKVNETIDVKKGETKSTLYNGSLDDDSGDLAVNLTATAHYEHLVLTYEVYYSNGTLAGTYENVYSDAEPARIPVGGTVEQVNTTHVKQNLTRDGLYEDSATEQLVVGHEDGTKIVAVNAPTDVNVTAGCGATYSEDVKPALDAAAMPNSSYIDNTSRYQFACYNVTYPADSKDTVTVTSKQPEPQTQQGNSFGAIDNEYNYYSYLVGSVASFKINSSNEWTDGTFNNTIERSGNLGLGVNYDNWEDGDITNSPAWTDGTGSGDTASIQSTTVKDGSNALKISIDGDSSGHAEIQVDKLDNTSIYDPHEFSTWVRSDTSGTHGAYWQFKGEDDTTGPYMYMGGDGQIKFHEGIGTTDLGSFDANTWYRYNITFLPDTDEIKAELKHENGTLMGSTTESFTSYDNVERVALHYSDDGTSKNLYFDKTAYSEAKQGSFTSQFYNTSEKKIWNNVTVGGLSQPGTSDVNLTVTTYNSGTQVNTTTLTFLTDGTNTYSLPFNNGATDVRFNYSLSSGSTPSIDNTTIQGHTANKKPAITSSKFIDNRKAGVTQADHSLDDKGEADLSSWSGDGTENTFTNSTLLLDITLPFTATFNVSDWNDATSSDKTVGVSETDSGLREDDYSHSLATQRANQTVTISNDASSSIDSNLTLQNYGTIIQGESWTDTISGGSVTHTGIWENDWLTSETEGSYIVSSNNSYGHTLGTQKLYNKTNLSVSNSRSFTFSSVDLSSTCSLTTTADVPAGTSEVTTSCNNASYTGDWLTGETETDVNKVGEDSSASHTLSTQYIRNETDLTVTNEQSFGFSSVGLSSQCENTASADAPSGTNQLTTNCSTVQRSGDWLTSAIESDVNTVGENASASHSLATQHILNETDLTLTNQQSFTFSSVDLSSRCENTASAGVPTGTNQVTTNCSTVERSGDWLTGETEGSYLVAHNRSTTTTVGQQYLYNQTNLSITNSRSSQFNNVDLSSQCGVTTSANVPAGTSEVTTACNNVSYTGDWISNQSYDMRSTKAEVTLGVDYLATQNIELNNQLDTPWTDINTTGAVPDPDTCTQTNQSIADLSANTTRNLTVELSCSPGTKGSGSQTIVDAGDADRVWFNITSIKIHTNATESSKITRKVDENDLKNWDNRKAGSANVWGDAQRSGVEFTDGEGFVYISINTSFGNSSWHTGTHSMALTYTYTTETTSDGGGGGAGGDPSSDDEDDSEVINPHITFEPRPSYTAAPDDTTTVFFTATNTLDKQVSVDLTEAPVQQYPGCRYIDIQQSLNQDPDNVEYGSNAVYHLNRSSASAGNTFRQRDLQARIDLPPQPNLTELGMGGTIKCRYNATATKGAAGDLVITVDVERSFWDIVYARLTSLTDIELFTLERQCFNANLLFTNEDCSEDQMWTYPHPTAAGVVVGASLLIVLLPVLFGLITTLWGVILNR
jgi:hypothetical protein